MNAKKSDNALLTQQEGGTSGRDGTPFIHKITECFFKQDGRSFTARLFNDDGFTIGWCCLNWETKVYEWTSFRSNGSLMYTSKYDNNNDLEIEHEYDKKGKRRDF